jgi:HK97 family phage major capsid protein/HK97 family phage prohead protease
MKSKRDYEEKSLQRDFTLEIKQVEKEDRTIEFPFSSELPVERYFGNEVLEHSREAANLKRLNDGAPFLWNHNPDQVLGVVERAYIDEKKKRGYAKVRFSEEEFADSKFRDVKNKILRNISFGYVINKAEEVEDSIVARDWEAFEVSLVSIPADNSIGISRSINNKIEANDMQNNNKKDNIMEEAHVSASSDALPTKLNLKNMTTNEKEIDLVRSEDAVNKALKSDRARFDQIRKTGKKYEMNDLADEYIRDGRSVQEFNQAVMDQWNPEKITPKPQDAEIGLSETEARSFSFIRALNYLANPGDRAAREAAAFEIEASNAAAKKAGRVSRGITVPYDVMRKQVVQRDLKTSPATQGGNLVQTDLDSANFIDLLRNSSVLDQAGATTLTGLQGNIAIPRQSGAATAYWVAEGGAPTESQQAIQQVSMVPRTCGAFTDISRKLLIQSSISVEQMVRNDIAKVIALEIDRAALYGTGSSNEPLGLHNTSGIGTESITANNPTFAQVVNMESDVAAANALMGNLAYITGATIRGAMKVKAKDSGSGLFLWDGNNTVNGYNAYMSNQIESGDLWFGNWSDCIIGYWSSLDLLVDPYTHSTSGTIRITALQDVDVAFRHAASFSLGA